MASRACPDPDSLRAPSADGSTRSTDDPKFPSIHVQNVASENESSGAYETDPNAPLDSDDEAWESLSYYEDLVEGMGDEIYPKTGTPDVCTPEETQMYKTLLRSTSLDNFIAQTIESGIITAKKLCTAFGILPPPVLEGAPDNAYYALLGVGINRELSKRIKLSHYNTIEDAVAPSPIKQNIVVVTGAGISTSLGIPDFRSKNTGLYSRLEMLGLSDPQEVFDIHLFREDPKIFYSIAKDILPSSKKFSPTHAFIRLLQDQDKLLTNFTQNIDNLEEHAGILKEKLIQCHGSFATATCQECRHNVSGDTIFEDLKAGKVPSCEACTRRLQQMRPVGMKRKRSSNGLHKSRKKSDFEDSSDEDDYEIGQPGVMKPDITFFGEDLPDSFHNRLVKHDKDLVDLVIVIGTSLKVAPVADIPRFLPPNIPQIYISREPCHHINFDIDLLGDCDIVVEELCKRAGWNLQHEMIPENQIIDISSVEPHVSRWQLKVHGTEKTETATSADKEIQARLDDIKKPDIKHHEGQGVQQHHDGHGDEKLALRPGTAGSATTGSATEFAGSFTVVKKVKVQDEEDEESEEERSSDEESSDG